MKDFIVNHWPFSNNLNDIIGKANLTNGPIGSSNFVKDRFFTSNSAVFLENSFLQLPPGVYLSGDFSILLWFQLIYTTGPNILINFGYIREKQDNSVVFVVLESRENLFLTCPNT